MIRDIAEEMDNICSISFAIMTAVFTITFSHYAISLYVSSISTHIHQIFIDLLFQTCRRPMSIQMISRHHHIFRTWCRYIFEPRWQTYSVRLILINNTAHAVNSNFKWWSVWKHMVQTKVALNALITLMTSMNVQKTLKHSCDWL